MLFLRCLISVAVAGAAAWIVAGGSRLQTRAWVPGKLGLELGPEKPEAVAPGAFLTRAFSGFRTPEERAWGERNGLTPALGFSHNLTTVFPPELYDTNPEFFPLVAGQRIKPRKGSYFWNPDLAREDVALHAARAAARHFEQRPDDVSFALGINDALIWGESTALVVQTTPVTWFRERPDYTGVTYRFMNRVAAELEKTHPQKYVGALAYYWTENAPAFPLHPQVIPFLTADRAQGYDGGFWTEELELQRRWRAAAEATTAAAPRRLGIYDYVYGSGFLVPRIHSQLLAAHLKHARETGFTDYYAEVYPNWGLDPVMPWLLARLVRDPSASAPALLDEFFRGYFGEAAAPMRRFYERCEEIWMGQPGPSYWLKHFRNESQIALFPPEVCRELRGYIEAARQLAWSVRVQARVRLASDAFGVTERYARFGVARERLLRLTLQGSGADAAIAAALEEYLAARAGFRGYTEALVAREPLALHAPVRFEDFLQTDPTAAALLALSDLRALPPAVRDDPSVAPLAIALTAEAGKRTEILRNPGMTGPLQPPRTIATLTYGMSMPVEWRSSVEPAQFHRGVLQDGPEGRVVRLEGTKDTTISQWVPLGGPGLHRAEIRVRGKVQPATAVKLVFAWLNGEHRHVGFNVVRLPEGEWPEWVTLKSAALPPADAAWVGLGLRVQNQVAGDWVEATGFSLTVEPAAK